MPWNNSDFPPSYKNQPVKLREKAIEIANKLLEEGAEEGIAIATGLKKAREFFAKKNLERDEVKAELKIRAGKK
jgi:uncharacterized protein YdaT